MSLVCGIDPVTDSARPIGRLVRIVVLGKPVSWKRAQRNPKTGAIYVDRDSENYRAIIREAARPHVEGHPLIEGPVRLSVLAVFAIPKNWAKYRKAQAQTQTVFKTGGIDLDNIIKAAKDSLNGVVYGDDSQVAAYGYCAKIYGERPRLEITLEAIESIMLDSREAGWRMLG